MGLTAYATPVTAPSLQSINVFPANGTTYTVTNMVYTNPNIVVTLSTAHNFQVGQTLALVNAVYSGTNPTQIAVNVTAVTSTTFTFNYGATAPGTYTSGGTVHIYIGSNPDMWYCSKYMNNQYFFAGRDGTVAYSSDGKNWNFTQVPNNGGNIIAMDFDGTTYAFATASTNQIHTTTTLAIGSFTSRTTNITGLLYDLKWCGGSIQRWIAVGGAAAGTTGYISQSTSGAASFTAITVGGTNSSTYNGIAFDGTSTIVVVGGAVTASSRTIAYSTNGTAFTGVLQSSTIYNSNSTGATNGSAAGHIYWNPTESRFVAFAGNTPVAASTSAGVSSTWYSTQNRFQSFDTTQLLQTTAAPTAGGNQNRSQINFDNNKIYVPSLSDTNFRVAVYDANPVTNTYSTVYTYPQISNYAVSFPSRGQLVSANYIPQNTSSTTYWCYGNGNFVLLSQFPSNISYAAVMQSALIA